MSRYRRWALLGALGVIAALAITLAGTLTDRANPAKAAGPGTGPDLDISAVGLTVTLSASGSGFDPYTGYSFGILVDTNKLAFASDANSMPGSPFCTDSPTSGSPAPPNFSLGCTLLGGDTTATGPLGSFTFTAVNGTPDCTVVSLVHYDTFLNNQDTGTYTLDDASDPQTVTYTVDSVLLSLNGAVCNAAPTDTPTATPTDTSTPGPSPTPTPCPNQGGCPTPAGYKTHTPTPTNTVAATDTPAPPPPTAAPGGGQPGGAPGGTGSGPGGGAGGSIQPPNTGNGPGRQTSGLAGLLLAVISVLGFAGASISVAGVVARRRYDD